MCASVTAGAQKARGLQDFGGLSHVGACLTACTVLSGDGVVAPVARLPLVAQCPNLPPHFEALVCREGSWGAGPGSLGNTIQFNSIQ